MDQEETARTGGPLSFDKLYRLYATDVLRFSYYYLGDRQQAEDVTQDVFVRLMVNRPELEEGREKAWLLKVAMNRCRDLWRGGWYRRMVLGHPAFELFPAPDEVGNLADRQSLLEAVHRLRPGALWEMLISVRKESGERILRQGR